MGKITSSFKLNFLKFWLHYRHVIIILKPYIRFRVWNIHIFLRTQFIVSPKVIFFKTLRKISSLRCFFIGLFSFWLIDSLSCYLIFNTFISLFLKFQKQIFVICNLFESNLYKWTFSCLNPFKSHKTIIYIYFLALAI